MPCLFIKSFKFVVSVRLTFLGLPHQSTHKKYSQEHEYRAGSQRVFYRIYQWC